jgi:uncharacterized membrane protein
MYTYTLTGALLAHDPMLHPFHEVAGIRTLSLKPTSCAFGCNVAVIVVGTTIAVYGILLWAVYLPRDNALRQILPALWLIQGLVGVLIAAIGVLGATLVSALNMPTESRAEPDAPP